jgi:hypothetical protein
VKQRIDQQGGSLRQIGHQVVHRNAHVTGHVVDHHHPGQLRVHQPGDHVAVAQHGPLGAPGGARSEENCAGIITLGILVGEHGFGRPALNLGRVKRLGQIEHSPGPSRVTDGTAALSVDQRNRGPGIFQHGQQFGAGTTAVHQHRDPARLHHGQKANQPFRPVAHADSHPVSRANVQHRHQLVAPGEELLEIQPAFVAGTIEVDHAGTLAKVPGTFDHPVKVLRRVDKLAEAATLTNLEGAARAGYLNEYRIKVGCRAHG